MRVYTGDPTLDSYNNKIQNCTNQIAMMNNRIKELERQIQELRQLISKLEQTRIMKEDVRSKTLGKIQGVRGAGFIPGCIVKGNIFNDLLDVINGPAYRKSNNALSDGIKKAQRKIRELEDEIADCKRSITSNRNTISNYNYKKNAYLKEKGKK